MKLARRGSKGTVDRGTVEFMVRGSLIGGDIVQYHTTFTIASLGAFGSALTIALDILLKRAASFKANSPKTANITLIQSCTYMICTIKADRRKGHLLVIQLWLVRLKINPVEEDTFFHPPTF